MKYRFLGLLLAGTAAAVLLVPQEKGTVEEDVKSQLPLSVRAVLAGGICDNIQGAFDSAIRDFPNVPQVGRTEALDRIEYYREWLRRKGCG